MTITIDQAAQEASELFNAHKVQTYLVVERENILGIHFINPVPMSEIINKLGWQDYPLTPENYHYQVAQINNVRFCALQLKRQMQCISNLAGFIPSSESTTLQSHVCLFDRSFIFMVSDNVSRKDLNNTYCPTGFSSIEDALAVSNSIRMIFTGISVTPVMTEKVYELMDGHFVVSPPNNPDLS